MKDFASYQASADDFRTIEAEDLAQLNDIYRPYSGRDIAVERVTEALRFYPSVVAIPNGEIAGFCYCFRFAPDIIELANIFVAKAWRHSGLGSKMLNDLLDQIRDPVRGVIAVNSFLAETNEIKASPDSFYIRNGFRIIANTDHSTVYWWERHHRGS